MKGPSSQRRQRGGPSSSPSGRAPTEQNDVRATPTLGAELYWRLVFVVKLVLGILIRISSGISTALKGGRPSSREDSTQDGSLSGRSSSAPKDSDEGEDALLCPPATTTATKITLHDAKQDNGEWRRSATLRHLDEFVKMRCSPELLRLSIYPNAKEITESMAAYHAYRTFFHKWLPAGSAIACVADGSSPRTAALFAFRNSKEFSRVLSIDPALKWDGPKYDEVRGMVGWAQSVYDIDTVEEPSLLVLVHAHVDLGKTMKKFPNCCGVIVLPCCNFPMELAEDVWGKSFDFVDRGIYCAIQTVRVWFRRHTPSALVPALPELTPREYAMGTSMGGGDVVGERRAKKKSGGALRKRRTAAKQSQSLAEQGSDPDDSHASSPREAASDDAANEQSSSFTRSPKYVDKVLPEDFPAAPSPSSSAKPSPSGGPPASNNEFSDGAAAARPLPPKWALLSQSLSIEAPSSTSEHGGNSRASPLGETLQSRSHNSQSSQTQHQHDQSASHVHTSSTTYAYKPDAGEEDEDPTQVWFNQVYEHYERHYRVTCGADESVAARYAHAATVEYLRQRYAEEYGGTTSGGQQEEEGGVGAYQEGQGDTGLEAEGGTREGPEGGRIEEGAEGTIVGMDLISSEDVDASPSED